MSPLLKRIISSIALIAVTIAAIFVRWLFGLVAISLIIRGLYEFFTMAEKKGINIYKYFGTTLGIIIPLSIFFKFELTKGWELLFIVLALITLFMLQFTRRENSGAVAGISTTIFGILYISWFFSFIIKLRDLNNGPFLVAALIFITKANDIGAYLVGTKWGRHALIPRISPHKSIEGTIGGFIFSMLAAIAVKPWLSFSYLHVAAIGGFLGVLAQLGDLSESLLKRDCQVKDASHLFPGLGGVLDLIDSILFTAPAFYFYMSAILK